MRNKCENETWKYFRLIFPSHERDYIGGGAKRPRRGRKIAYQNIWTWIEVIIIFSLGNLIPSWIHNRNFFHWRALTIEKRIAFLCETCAQHQQQFCRNENSWSSQFFAQLRFVVSMLFAVAKIDFGQHRWTWIKLARTENNFELVLSFNSNSHLKRE